MGRGQRPHRRRRWPQLRSAARDRDRSARRAASRRRSASTPSPPLLRDACAASKWATPPASSCASAVPSGRIATTLRDAGFLHSDEPWMPTWWTALPARAPVITGWSGGPRAEAAPADPAAWVPGALASLARHPRVDADVAGGRIGNVARPQLVGRPVRAAAPTATSRVGGLPAQERSGSRSKTRSISPERPSTPKATCGTVHGAMATRPAPPARSSANKSTDDAPAGRAGRIGAQPAEPAPAPAHPAIESGAASIPGHCVPELSVNIDALARFHGEDKPDEVDRRKVEDRHCRPAHRIRRCRLHGEEGALHLVGRLVPYPYVRECVNLQIRRVQPTNRP